MWRIELITSIYWSSNQELLKSNSRLHLSSENTLLMLGDSPLLRGDPCESIDAIGRIAAWHTTHLKGDYYYNSGSLFCGRLSVKYILPAVVLVATCLPVSLIEAQTDQKKTQPNILWLFQEDLSPWLGCYGHKVQSGQTPVIDAMASTGVRFSRAYVPAPVCSNLCRAQHVYVRSDFNELQN